MLAVALPSISFGCQQNFDRKIAFYFIAPFGLLACALGYPQHQSPAVVGGTLGGVSSVLLAATWAPLAPYRLLFNLGGCAVMLGSQWMGDSIAKDKVQSDGSSAACSAP